MPKFNVEVEMRVVAGSLEEAEIFVDQLLGDLRHEATVIPDAHVEQADWAVIRRALSTAEQKHRSLAE